MIDVGIVFIGSSLLVLLSVWHHIGKIATPVGTMLLPFARENVFDFHNSLHSIFAPSSSNLSMSNDCNILLRHTHCDMTREGSANDSKLHEVTH